METATERKRACSQRRAHAPGQLRHLPHLGLHRPEIAAASECRAEHDEIVVFPQFGLQTFQFADQWRKAPRPRFDETELIPERLELFAPGMNGRRSA